MLQKGFGLLEVLDGSQRVCGCLSSLGGRGKGRGVHGGLPFSCKTSFAPLEVLYATWFSSKYHKLDHLTLNLSQIICTERTQYIFQERFWMSTGLSQQKNPSCDLNHKKMGRGDFLFNLFLIVSYFFQTDQFHASTTLRLVSNKIINCPVLTCKNHQIE